MGSIITELQSEIVSPDCNIANTLRKAHLIASKLGLDEFDQWLTNELNGYKSGKDVPDYRKVKGVLKYHNPYSGWWPVMLPDNESEDKICRTNVTNSLPEIIQMCISNKDIIFRNLSPELIKILNEMYDFPIPMQFAVYLPGTSVENIIDRVKNAILEWTLKLEAEGILGDSMVFTATEKQAALNVPQTINNYYGNTNVMTGPVSSSSIVAGDGTAVSFTYESAQAATRAIAASLAAEPIAQDEKDTAAEMLAEMDAKIVSQKKPSIIKAGMIGLKDFLIGVGASATVALIQAKMQGLF